MSELHLVVCMKVVPKPEEIQVDPDTHLLKRANVRTEINPADMNALEMALGLKDKYGGSVSILSMGPPAFEHHLRVSLAMGANHIFLLSDRVFGGADTLATTYTLAQGIKKMGRVDLVLCGEESSDGATGQVPQGLAEWMGLPQLTIITEIDLDMTRNVVKGHREIKGGYEILEVPMPCVVSIKSACNEARFMDFRLKQESLARDRLTVWDAKALGVDSDYIGAAGSPTWVSGLSTAPSRDRKCIRFTGTPEETALKLADLIKQIL